MLPRSSSLSTAMVPLCAATMALAMVSPRPVPGIACRVAASERKNLSKIRSRSPAGMPMPVSATASTAWSPCMPTLTSTLPPSGVNFTALEMRLPASWAMRSGSRAKQGRAAAERASSMCFR